MCLAEFDFEILHKKRSLNTQADAISRLPTKGPTTEHEEADIPCLSLCDTYLEIRKGEEVTEEPTFEDEAANSLDIIVANFPDIRSALNRGDTVRFRDNPDTGVLERISLDGHKADIPEELQPRLLHIAHYPQKAGKPGG
eukprot:IDg19902t1